MNCKNLQQLTCWCSTPWVGYVNNTITQILPLSILLDVYLPFKHSTVQYCNCLMNSCCHCSDLDSLLDSSRFSWPNPISLAVTGGVTDGGGVTFQQLGGPKRTTQTNKNYEVWPWKVLLPGLLQSGMAVTKREGTGSVGCEGVRQGGRVGDPEDTGKNTVSKTNDTSTKY